MGHSFPSGRIWIHYYRRTINSMMNTMCKHIKYEMSRMSALLVVFLFSSTNVVFAGDGFVNPLKAKSLQELLVQILNAVIFILFPIIVLMIVYTGFLFVAAQGNPTKLTEVRKALVWTVVGALVVLGSKALALAIEATVSSFTP